MGKEISSKILEVNHVVVQKLAEYSGLGIDKLNADSRIADIGLDSLDVVETIMDIEEQFDVHISDEEAETYQTIGDISKSVYSKLVKEQGDPELI